MCWSRPSGAVRSKLRRRHRDYGTTAVKSDEETTVCGSGSSIAGEPEQHETVWGTVQQARRLWHG